MDRIKIGRSQYPMSRARGLPERIDYDRSFQVLVPDALAAEKALHREVGKYWIAPPGKSDGATEWFDSRGFVLITSFIERNPALFPDPRMMSLDQKLETIPMQFKMPSPFARRFKMEAARRGMKMNELLEACFELYEQQRDAGLPANRSTG